MNKLSNAPLLVRVIISVFLIFGLFYLNLPPINLRSPHFWFFIMQCIIVCIIANFFGSISEIFGRATKYGQLDTEDFKEIFGEFTRPVKYGIIALIGIFCFIFLGNLIGHPLLWSSNYYNLLKIEEGNFAKEVSQVSSKNIPVVDRDSASRLGKRKLGEMSDLVSQFDIMENYTQINYKGTPYRVTPLRYGDGIKWLYNMSEGIPAYITVNMVTQESALVRLDKGIKYSESEYFFRNIHRFLRFKYPTKIFDEISFEIDDNGTPYWIAPTISYRVALWDGEDIDGAVLVNAQTGESKYYDLKDIPNWVDQVFISDLIIRQLIYHGRYVNGYINSKLGQKGVLQPTDGYNYLAINDDVYLYTGLTSVMSDASNVGFVLVNLRTKEAKYYNVPGAEERSAMSSAMGKVQHLNYKATFPILLNIKNRPTYFLSLKDGAGLVKMYAFVDVEQYQVVGTGSTVPQALENFFQTLGVDGTPASTDNGSEKKKSGVISAMSQAVVSGNTAYYFILTDDKKVYRASIEISEKLPFLRVGDKIDFIYTDMGKIGEVKELQ
ncbi:MAG: hypothetical protein Q4D21_05965 [Phascolarctobacterium sp.]|nr:hypothetical protein [Phascolarctobacterium sp.]